MLMCEMEVALIWRISSGDIGGQDHATSQGDSMELGIGDYQG
jgi:hypothetical protein